MTMTIPTPDPNYNFDIPNPYKMPPNAWEVGYYDGYNKRFDQRFWANNNLTLKQQYRKGWSEGSQFRILETIVKRNNT